MAELKPCPCCGGGMYTHHCLTIEDGKRMEVWFIRCSECGKSYLTKPICRTEAEAIEAWNTEEYR